MLNVEVRLVVSGREVSLNSFTDALVTEIRLAVREEKASATADSSAGHRRDVADLRLECFTFEFHNPQADVKVL